MDFSSIFLIFWVRKYHDHKFFFSTCQIDLPTSPSTYIIEKLIFQGFENGEKVTSDMKILDIFKDCEVNFLSFRIRVQNL